MKFRPVFFGSLLTVSTLSMSLLAVADDAQPPANKQLIFSQPASTNGVPEKDSLFNQLDDPFGAPPALFGKKNNSASDPLPAPPPVTNYRPADDQKNWILMTPEEILGVKTPEQVMGVQSSKNLALDNLSSEQRFMDRHRQADNVFTNTDGDSDLGKWSAARERKLDDPAFNNANAPDSQGAFQSLSRMMTVERLNSPFAPAGLTANESQPYALPKPDQIARQKADMDAFRAMLGEHVEPDTPKTADNFPTPAAAHKTGVSAQQAAFAAGSYGSILKPLNDEASKPVGLDLPSAWGAPKKKKAETPSWAPKPPPWLTQDPVLNSGAPQRKF